MFGGSYTKSSINEANLHMQALMKRIAELEEQNRVLESANKERDQEFETCLRDLSHRFEAEINEAQQQLRDADKQLERLHTMCEEKDVVIDELRRRVSLLDSIMPHANAMIEVARIVERARRSYDTLNVGGAAGGAAVGESDGDHTNGATTLHS